MRHAATPSPATPRCAHSRRVVSLAALLALLSSLGGALFVAQTAGAATSLFVSASGSDSNPCTAASPCATVTHALSLAGSGDTIEVAGTIHDAVTVSTTVTIEQWPGQAPAKIDASGLDQPVFLNQSGNLTVDGLTITGGSSVFGAGIETSGGGTRTTVAHSTITANTAIPMMSIVAPGGGSGGAIAIRPNDVFTITDSTISANTAEGNPIPGPGGGRGGAIFNLGTLTIANSTVADNTAAAAAAGASTSGVGGGVWNGGTLTVTDSTIAGNVAAGPSSGGGGIFAFVLGTVPTIGASIVATNTATGTTNNCSGAVTSVGYNLTDDTAGTACGFTQATDKVNVNPDLGSPANNGGPTQTLLPAPISPAIGVIPSPTTLNGLPVCGPGAFDQRGVPRPSPGPKCTIGAVEVAGPAPSTSGTASQGYWLVGADGGVFSFGGAPFLGSMAGKHLNAPIVDMDATSDGGGYQQVGADGGVFSFGDAQYFGSMAGKPLNAPIVAIKKTSDDLGYWLVGADGGVFAFGDAHYFGSMAGTPLNAPIVDIKAPSDDGGYWLVSADGGVFSFGDARFAGSMAGTRLDEPVVEMVHGSDDQSYSLAAADGGVFCFGSAQYFGSMAGTPLNAPIVDIKRTTDHGGYWLVGADGGVFAFGDANYLGGMAGKHLNAPIVGLNKS